MLGIEWENARPEFASELPNDSRTHSRIAVVYNRWAVVTGRRRIIRGGRIVCRSDHPTLGSIFARWRSNTS